MPDRTSEEFIKAKTSAVRYVIYRKRTIFETTNKLLTLGYDRIMVDEIVTDLVKEGYLDDDQYIRMYIKEKSKLSKRILQIKLKEKGIDIDKIKNYLSEYNTNEIHNILILLKKKKYNKLMDSNEQNKIKMYCMRKGFKMSDIEKAIREGE